MANAELISARSLLRGFLELSGLSSDLADWTEERMTDNPPRLYRLRQLKAMFRAFGLSWDLQSFIEGKFIQPDPARYATLLSKFKEEKEFRWSRMSPHVEELPEFFAKLFDYRSRINNVLTFTEPGMMMGNGLGLYAHFLARKLDRIILDNVSIVEDTMVALINPEAVEFPVEQLVRDFGYPNVDLFDVDSDWW